MIKNKKMHIFKWCKKLRNAALLSAVFLTSSYSKTLAQDGAEQLDPGGGGSSYFDNFNPLKIANSPIADDLSTPGGILSRVLEFAFPIAGLILFVMIVWGGFEILSQSATKKSTEAGRQRITSAIIGFLLLFVSYWIIEVIERVFGITIFL